MGGRVHPLKRSVSWVNSVQRQFLAYGPILFLVPVSEATQKQKEVRRAKRSEGRIIIGPRLFYLAVSFLFRGPLIVPAVYLFLSLYF